MFHQEAVIAQSGGFEQGVPDKAEFGQAGKEAHGIGEGGNGRKQAFRRFGSEAVEDGSAVFFGQEDAFGGVFAELSAHGLLVKDCAVISGEGFGEVTDAVRLTVREEVKEEEVQADVIVGEAARFEGAAEGIFRDACAVESDGDLFAASGGVTAQVIAQPAFHAAFLVVVGARALAVEIAAHLEAINEEFAHIIARFVEVFDQFRKPSHTRPPFWSVTIITHRAENCKLLCILWKSLQFLLGCVILLVVSGIWKWRGVMPNFTLSKSTDDKWKFAYKLAVALVPAAVELCGFPKTLELLEKPLSALIEHLTGESVDWLFKEQGELEKTAVIIGDALKKLLEDERYNYLETFFSEAKFDFSKVNLVSGENALADHFCDRFMEWSKIPSSQKSMNQQFMRQFTNDLFVAVKSEIGEDTKLADYWRGRDTNETVHEIRDVLVKAHNHNADYIRAWNARCCLHDDSQANVTLSTVFVMPEVEIEEKRYGIDVLVKDFLKEDNKKQNILLLLGHGGYGKTSFVARMAANTSEYTSKPLHIFRLRYFPKAEIGNLCEEIETISNGNLAEDDVIVFDGLDELCMIGGRCGEEQKKATQLMMELIKFWREHSSRKLIVTSRPNYVDVSDIVTELIKQTPLGKRKPVLQSYEYAAFDVHQREQLVDKLEKADPALRGNTGCSYIRQMDENEDDPIYSSPFILYLICAGGDAINEEHFQNRWLLFRTVFHDVLFNPAYRNGDNERDRFFREHRDKLYYITCCLAYEIYKSGYKIQYFQREDVLNIIRAIYPEETKSVAFANALCDCHALCTYFQKNADGAIEFAHNHVRDFFLCEYILQEMNDIYKKYSIYLEKCGEMVANWWSEKFRFAYGENVTFDFAQNAVCAENYPNLLKDCTTQTLHHIFNTFCRNGGLHRYDSEKDIHGVHKSASYVIKNASSFFYFFLHTYLVEEKVQWFDIAVFNSGEREIIENMKYKLENTYLVGAKLNGTKLTHASLDGADLNRADLSDSDLRHATLKFAKMEEAGLINTDLSAAILFATDLCGADLRGAKLDDAICTYARYDDDTCFDMIRSNNFSSQYADMLYHTPF